MIYKDDPKRFSEILYEINGFVTLKYPEIQKNYMGKEKRQKKKSDE
jgi:hypothetical protein